MGALQRLPATSGALTARAIGLWAGLLAAVGSAPLHAQTTQPLDEGVRVQAREERYTIEGHSFAEVAAVLNGMRLEGADAPLAQGLTQYWIEPQWQYRPDADGCAVTTATVDVSIVITLPRWPGAATAHELDRELWKELHASIVKHEYRHRDITVEAASALLGEIRSLRAGTCAALARAVDAQMALAREAMEERHAAFDLEDSLRPR